mmetsp:Transcript_100799/g.314236  ORF Transcript_100799/g.314236 Transcript_100799/m.314236 type:complete len:253 (-) Transcript_100799:758-1516(-)
MSLLCIHFSDSSMVCPSINTSLSFALSKYFRSISPIAPAITCLFSLIVGRIPSRITASRTSSLSDPRISATASANRSISSDPVGRSTSKHPFPSSLQNPELFGCSRPLSSAISHSCQVPKTPIFPAMDITSASKSKAFASQSDVTSNPAASRYVLTNNSFCLSSCSFVIFRFGPHLRMYPLTSRMNETSIAAAPTPERSKSIGISSFVSSFRSMLSGFQSPWKVTIRFPEAEMGWNAGQQRNLPKTPAGSLG